MSLHNDEIQKLLVDIFELTDCKISADDPVVAMMLIQRQEIAKLVQQHQAQQQFFLDEFTQKANAIIQSAEEFKGQKQLIVSEILQANADELAQNEAKMYANISQRIQEQFKDMIAVFFHNLETRSFRLLMILLVVQVGVLLASLIL